MNVRTNKSPLDSAREYYLVFVSIVFGIFLTTWAEPVIRHFDAERTTIQDSSTEDRSEPRSSEAARTTSDNRVLRTTQGFLTLLVIVSLWWWYGVFIRWFSPARGFVMYMYDFVSLAAFAVATGLWTNSTAFPTIIPIASILIFVRFWWVLPYTRKIPVAETAIKSALWILLLNIGAHVLVSAGVILGSLTSDGDSDNAWRSSLAALSSSGMVANLPNFLMVLSIGVTLWAAQLTEGLRWGRVFQPSTFDMYDRLLDPLDECTVPGRTLSELRALRNRAFFEFQRGLVESGAHRTWAATDSLVHSAGDLHSQAGLPAFAADLAGNDLVERMKLMYFVHWLDDVLDRSKALSKLTTVFQGDPSDFDVLADRLPRWSPSADAFRRLYRDSPFFEIGVVRLAYGGLLFKDEAERDRVRRTHKQLLSAQGVDPNLLSHDPYVDLSVKTVTEFWFGMEAETLPFAYSYLFSLLYGPGLYYHDVDEEERAREHSASWGTLDEERTASFIAEIGGRIDDERRALPDKNWEGRLREIRAFITCFSPCLPGVVRGAYEQLLEQFTPSEMESPPAIEELARDDD